MKVFKADPCRLRPINRLPLRPIVLAVLLIASGTGNATVNTFSDTSAESLTLQSLLDETLRSHPSLGAARVEVKAAGQDVEAAKLQRLPSLTVGAERGTDSNESRSSVQLKQTIWDGGRVRAGIDSALVGEQVARESIRSQWWSLAQQIIDAWQQLLAFAGKRDVAHATIAKLEELQASMQRRVATGASPEIDLDLVHARLLQAQTELQEAQVGLRTTLATLAQLSGVLELTQLPIDSIQPERLPVQDLKMAAAQYADTDWPAMAAKSPLVVTAHYAVSRAEQQMKARQAERWPEVFVRLDQPLGGNGSNNGDRSMAAFIGLSYTPGNGFSSFSAAKAAATRVGAAEENVGTAIREMRKLQDAQVETFFGTQARLESLRASVDSSASIVSSYERQFIAGRKSWQDVMNAVRDLAQNEYAWQDANARVAGSLYQLKLLSGQLDKNF
ncbi:TolC family protein [Pseudomonas sp. ZM23]|uniref:TolC family protein n=1 Tax=Pseudomonas triclosanedens TaxID=2961893 RepID=A0ABY7A2Q5_9PSED|nr:TolC family protein [Pseudomonas triclosanedens]MCP8464707.1 TolC family protein [Pseudomonas triclosanedens]MCP8470580.1 TolC family protein [Pseudomonas triclosanedens]MCP8479863.1 TolC family protein [Pseudomonas triclosanedens]WAI51388.1 TolC family protein [Pseudomonas triclosanedens]